MIKRLSIAVVLLHVAIISCSPSNTLAANPVTEFLLVSDDSTTWVRSAPDTVAIERAPLLLALLDNRLIEIFVVEEPIEFQEASFLVTRAFRRDLVTGDSTLVFADSVVLRAAFQYARTHPDADRLPNDEPAPEPASALESSLTPLDIIGHTIGLDVHIDRTDGELGTHDTYRATVDLRSGQRLTLDSVVGIAVARQAEQSARATLRTAIVAAATGGDAVSEAASRALATLKFDPLAFSLGRTGDSLAVQYLAHDEQVIDDARDSHRFDVARIALPAPAWWLGARNSLPLTLTDSTARLMVGTVMLNLGYDNQDVASISASTGVGVRPVARMRGPVRRVITIGDSVTQPLGRWRPALARAFAEAGYTSDAVRTASFHSSERPLDRRRRMLQVNRKIASQLQAHENAGWQL